MSPSSWTFLDLSFSFLSVGVKFFSHPFFSLCWPTTLIDTASGYRTGSDLLIVGGKFEFDKKNAKKFWNSFFLNKICRVLVWTFERVKWGQSCNRLSRREWNFFFQQFSLFVIFFSKFNPVILVGIISVTIFYYFFF
jgi:hypothetical protein